MYFSLGSVAKGTTIPEKYKKILIQVFSKLKQRIIWKFEDDLHGLPQNILVRKWLPQQDILGKKIVSSFCTNVLFGFYFWFYWFVCFGFIGFIWLLDC